MNDFEKYLQSIAGVVIRDQGPEALAPSSGSKAPCAVSPPGLRGVECVYKGMGFSISDKTVLPPRILFGIDSRGDLKVYEPARLRELAATYAHDNSDLVVMCRLVWAAMNPGVEP